MTQQPLFSQIPRYNLPTTTPFTRQTATTFLERLEEIFTFIVEIQAVVTERDEAYGKLVRDANTAISTALETMRGIQDGVHEDADKVAVGLLEVDRALKALNDFIAASENRFKAVEDSTAKLREADTLLSKDIEALAESMAAEAKRHVPKDHLFIDVTDHGAIGDGVADDTAAIKASIALAGDGGTVYLPHGKYLVNQTVTVPVSVRVLGVGSDRDLGAMSGTTVYFSGGDTPCFILQGGAKLESLNVVSKTNLVGTGVYVKASGFRMHDVCVRSFGKGVHTDSCWYGHISDCQMLFNNVGLYAYYSYNLSVLDTKLHSRALDDTMASANGPAGTCVDLGYRTMVKFTHCSFEGYSTAVNVQGSTNLYIAGSYFEAADNQTSAVGIRARNESEKNLVSLIGNDIVMTWHSSFLYLSTKCTERLVSIANKFTGGNVESNCVYLGIASEGGPLRIVAMGDSITQAVKCAYVVSPSYIPDSSLVSMPYGVADAPEGLYSTGTTWLGNRTRLRPVSVRPTMHPDWEGGLIFNSATKSLEVWDGANWRSATGTVL